jgi:hypothetical protein
VDRTGDLGFGIWDLGFGIWDLGFGIWDLGFGIWDLGFGIWDLGFGIWPPLLERGRRKHAAGGVEGISESQIPNLKSEILPLALLACDLSN